MKRHLKVIALVATILGAGCIVAVGSANAIDRGTLRKFAENNIYFYNPEGSNNCSSNSTSTTLAGITPRIQSGSNTENAKVVLDALIKAGYKPIAAAAIAGNIEWEGGFYPCKIQNKGTDCASVNAKIDEVGNETYLTSNLSGVGFGMVQWTIAERKKGLATTAGSRRVSELEVQIEHMIKELTTDSYYGSQVDTLNGIADGEDGLIWATWQVYKKYEAPGASFRWEGGTEGKDKGNENKKKPDDPFTLNETDHAGAYKEFYGKNSRLAAALYYLNMLEAGGQVNQTSHSATVSGTEVTIVTDDNVPEDLKTAITEKISGAEVTSSLDNARKYIIYTANMDAAVGKDDIQSIADSVATEKTIFFVSSQVSTVNAVKEVAKSKENVKIIDATAEDSSAALAEKIYSAIQAVASAVSRKLNPCTGGTIGGITSKVINGINYVYPHPGTTRANYNPDGAMTIFLPLDQYNFATTWSGHHDYPAVDIGRNVDNKGNSEGAPVVAFSDGWITDYNTYTTSQPHCASITFKSVDGGTYWIGHTSYDSQYLALKGSKGDTSTMIKAGTQIGVVGPASCANYDGSGAQHTHIDERYCNDPNKGATRNGYLCYYYSGWHNYYSTHIIDIMAQLYWTLPEKD